MSCHVMWGTQHGLGSPLLRAVLVTMPCHPPCSHCPLTPYLPPINRLWPSLPPACAPLAPGMCSPLPAPPDLLRPGRRPGPPCGTRGDSGTASRCPRRARAPLAVPYGPVYPERASRIVHLFDFAPSLKCNLRSSPPPAIGCRHCARDSMRCTQCTPLEVAVSQAHPVVVMWCSVVECGCDVV